MSDKCNPIRYRHASHGKSFREDRTAILLEREKEVLMIQQFLDNFGTAQAQVGKRHNVVLSLPVIGGNENAAVLFEDFIPVDITKQIDIGKGVIRYAEGLIDENDPPEYFGESDQWFL